eukprot:scaffold6420_cov168-Amphora_coffeaeformis.AAC.8
MPLSLHEHEDELLLMTSCMQENRKKSTWARHDSGRTAVAENNLRSGNRHQPHGHDEKGRRQEFAIA